MIDRKEFEDFLGTLNIRHHADAIARHLEEQEARKVKVQPIRPASVIDWKTLTKR